VKYLCVLLLLSGCRLKQYDPVTADQISRTLSYETATYDYVVAALEDGVWAADERLGLEVRHESELARLEAWLRAEEAKDTGAK
jgi:hypothetical protein